MNFAIAFAGGLCWHPGATAEIDLPYPVATKGGVENTV